MSHHGGLLGPPPRARRRIRTGPEQQPRLGHLAVVAGQRQCRVAVAVAPVDVVGVDAREDVGDEGGPTGDCGAHEDRRAVAGGRGQVGLMGQQQAGHSLAPQLGGHVQGAAALPVHGIHVRAVHEEAFHAAEQRPARRVHERREPLPVRRGHQVLVRLEQVGQRVELALAHASDELGLGAGQLDLGRVVNKHGRIGLRDARTTESV